MPIVREYLPSFAAGGQVALDAGQGLFEQREDQFQFGQDRFAAQLGEQQRQFDVRTGLAAQQAQQAAAERALAREQNLAMAAADMQARDMRQEEQFRQQQMLQAQQDAALAQRMQDRVSAEELLNKRKFERQQGAALDERAFEQESASNNAKSVERAMSAELQELEQQIPGDPVVKRYKTALEAYQKEKLVGVDPRDYLSSLASLYEDFRDEDFSSRIPKEPTQEEIWQDYKRYEHPEIPGVYFMPDGRGGVRVEDLRKDEKKEDDGIDVNKIRDAARSQLALEGESGFSRERYKKIFSDMLEVEREVLSGEQAAPAQEVGAMIQLPNSREGAAQAMQNAPIGSRFTAPDGVVWEKVGADEWAPQTGNE